MNEFARLRWPAMELFANASILVEMLEEKDPQRSMARTIVNNAASVRLVMEGLLEHIATIDADRQDLREELEKLGKRAFWARRKKDSTRTE